METIETVRHLLDFHFGGLLDVKEWRLMRFIESRNFWDADWADKTALIGYAVEALDPQTDRDYMAIIQNPEGHYEAMAAGMLIFVEGDDSIEFDSDEFCYSGHHDCREDRPEVA